MRTMDEIVYWIKTKRAPCLYKYDMINNRHGDAHCSKSKDTSPGRDINLTFKNKKKRRLSIFDESESEQHEKNIYFDDAPHVPQGTDISTCKDSIITNIESNIKTTKSKAHKIEKSSSKAITRTTACRRNLRSINKTQRMDSSLESGLFSGETKIKQSSLSKSLSKKSADKYPDNTPSRKVKVSNGLFDDISDVSGFTASYIRSTKNNSSRKLPKTKNNNKQLIKESQNKMCANKRAETARDPLHCSSDSSNIINVVTVNNDEKDTSLLKFPTPSRRDAPKRGRPPKKETTVQNKVPSRYFTRSKASSIEDSTLFNSENTSTPIKVCNIINKSRVSHKRLSKVSSTDANVTRDKSGYTACFSDTDSEQPERKRNFFD